MIELEFFKENIWNEKWNFLGLNTLLFVFFFILIFVGDFLFPYLLKVCVSISFLEISFCGLVYSHGFLSKRFVFSFVLHKLVDQIVHRKNLSPSLFEPFLLLIIFGFCHLDKFLGLLFGHKKSIGRNLMFHMECLH